ncbi:MAG: hypothetical protein V2I33_16525, partial [Kangiellaceae bacterium]|nr:hypothetical protein [Kangiellaceae bacterium]
KHFFSGAFVWNPGQTHGADCVSDKLYVGWFGIDQVGEVFASWSVSEEALFPFFTQLTGLALSLLVGEWAAVAVSSWGWALALEARWVEHWAVLPGFLFRTFTFLHPTLIGLLLAPLCII